MTSLGNGQYSYSFDAGTGTQAGDHSFTFAGTDKDGDTARDTITVKVENTGPDAVDDVIYIDKDAHFQTTVTVQTDGALISVKGEASIKGNVHPVEAQAARSSAVSTPPATARSAKTTRCSRKPKPTFSGVSSPTTTAIRSASAT